LPSVLRVKHLEDLLGDGAGVHAQDITKVRVVHHARVIRVLLFEASSSTIDDYEAKGGVGWEVVRGEGTWGRKKADTHKRLPLHWKQKKKR
jgi:hypothetical protein